MSNASALPLVAGEAGALTARMPRAGDIERSAVKPVLGRAGFGSGVLGVVWVAAGDGPIGTAGAMPLVVGSLAAGDEVAPAAGEEGATAGLPAAGGGLGGRGKLAGGGRDLGRASSLGLLVLEEVKFFLSGGLGTGRAAAGLLVVAGCDVAGVDDTACFDAAPPIMIEGRRVAGMGRGGVGTRI